jgi:hypothetical protein
MAGVRAEPFSQELLTPFPSDVYTIEDSTSSTGVRVNFRDDDLRPGLVDLLPPGMRPEELSKADGFSAATPMTLVFRERVDHKRLPSTPAESINNDAPIKLVDIDTGKPVPYVVHIPVINPIGRDPLTLVRLYPYARLQPARRYVLYATGDLPLIRKGQRPERFGLFERFLAEEAPENEREEYVFKRLRPFLEAVRASGEDVSRIVIITGFTIRSDDNAIAPMAEAGRAALDLPPPEVTIIKVRENLLREYVRVEGVIHGPAVIDREGKLQWEGGAIKIEGKMDIPFIMFVPAKTYFSFVGPAEPRNAPNPVIVFCQGGPPAKRKHYWMETLYKRYLSHGIAMICIDSPSNRELDWRKKPTRARTSFPGTTDPGANTAEMAQWAIDVRTVVSAIKAGKFDVLPNGAPDGVPELDPERIGYTGISYGGINGLFFTAMEPRFAASVIQVGGTQWVRLPAEHMMADLQGDGKLYEKGVLPGERPFWLAAAQLAFDLVEPTYYASHMWEEPLYPREEPMPLLTQSGYKDSQVRTSEAMNAVLGLADTPGEPHRDPPPYARAKWYGGPLYPNGHVAPVLNGEARDDRFEVFYLTLQKDAPRAIPWAVPLEYNRVEVEASGGGGCPATPEARASDEDINCDIDIEIKGREVTIFQKMLEANSCADFSATYYIDGNDLVIVLDQGDRLCACTSRYSMTYRLKVDEPDSYRLIIPGAPEGQEYEITIR